MGTEKQSTTDESINYQTAYIIASCRQLVDSLSPGGLRSKPCDPDDKSIHAIFTQTMENKKWNI
jgi:hypothetical protein